MFQYLMAGYLHSWLFPFFFTITTETIILWLFVRKIFHINGRDLPLTIVIAAGIFANGFTHPQVWFVFPFIFQSYTIAIVIAELFAFIAEAIFYNIFLKITIKRALIVSLSANAFSFLAGIFLHFFVNSKIF
ncbi:MAG: hypothetical protein KGJ89_01370 [Patescibacteria group bacterium]|nr:hypothetical protein [Patescibacteria group bacterium]MDE2015162.1 hypothetical protein [Patescibacteria group bacterium]MDE2226590.1 hypothetical protein [Patescibacteria group bacterium]